MDKLTVMKTASEEVTHSLDTLHTTMTNYSTEKSTWIMSSAVDN